AIGASVRAKAVSGLIFPVLVLGALLYVFLPLDVPWGLFVALPFVAAATALTLRLTRRARWRGRRGWRWAMPSAGSGSGYSSSGSPCWRRASAALTLAAHLWVRDARR